MNVEDIGRLLGLVYWPLLLGVAIYIIGWLVSAPRQPPVADAMRGWFKLAAILASLAMFVLLAYYQFLARPPA